ncbi:hypothetical protein TNCV_4233431 [Trichonephila clavipes]|nr:hypothetical protein TNCV_4233431 [Trichonephila clavipes]
MTHTGWATSLVLDSGLSGTTFKMLSSRLELRTAHVWSHRMNIFHEVDDVTAETILCDPAFVDQETARDNS